MSKASTRQLDQSEFDRVISVLEGEQKAMQPSTAQRFSYWMYTAFIWGLVLFLLAASLFRVTGSTEATSSVLKFLVIAIAGCFIGGIVSFLLNVPLIYKIVRQWFVIRHLGFSSTSSVLWRAHQNTRRASVVVGRVAVGLGVILLVSGAVMAIMGLAAACTIFLALGTLLIMFFILASGKSWLDMMSNRWKEVTQLKESILRLKDTAATSDGHIPISEDAIKRFSVIENEQIVRSRIKAVAESASATKEEYSVLSSRDLLKAKAALNASDRLRIEQVLDDLSLDPQPAGVEVEPSGRLRCRVKGTDLALIYTVDTANRQLRVLMLQGGTGGTTHA